jgi:hypothetical protein
MMTVQRLQNRITALTMAAILLTCWAPTADGGDQSAQLTLQMTPLGPVSPGPQPPQIDFSPDRQRTAIIATRGSRQAVMVDGQIGPAFSQIVHPPSSGGYSTAKVLFSADSQSFTYIGDPDGTQEVIVTDGKPGPGYDRIRWVQYSPVGHRLAYAAEKLIQPVSAADQPPGYQRPKVTVVVDGKPGPAFERIQNSSGQSGIQFSSDGRRFGYVGMAQVKEGPYNQTRNLFHAVIDGTPGPGYDGIHGLNFSPDGGSVAYVVQRNRTGTDFSVVINGMEGPGYRSILSPDGSTHLHAATVLFSEDGRHYAYIAAKSPEPAGKITSYVLVVDGQEVVTQNALSQNGVSIQRATLSPNGRRWAYVGLESGGQSYGPPNKYIIVDGQKSRNYIECSGIVFSPDSRHVASIVTNANRKQFVIYDGMESEPYTKVLLESLQFGPNSIRYGYIAQRERDWVAVVDGRPGPPHRSIEPKSLRFINDGRHFSYTVGGQSNKQGLTVVDHEVLGSHALTSPDGTRTVHVNVEGAGTGSAKSTIVLDGKPYGPTFSSVDQLQMSPDGNRIAAIGTYAGSSNKKLARLFVDGQEGPESWGIQQLVFTPDSRHVVYVDEIDRKINNSSVRAHQLMIDGQSIAEFDRVIMHRTFDPHTNQSSVEGGLGFLPDGALEFIATRDETVYRVHLSHSGLDHLPSLEQSAAARPGPRPLLRFEAHSKEAGEPGNLAIGPDGTLFATASRGGRYKQGFLFRTKPDGTEMQVLYDFLGNKTDGSDPNALIYGPSDMLYGILSQGGENNTGSIFKVKTDGSGFIAIHHFDSRSRQPELISVEADGSIYGMVADPVRLFRVPATGGEYAVVYESVTDRDRGYLESERDRIVSDITGLKKTLENFKEFPDAQTAKAVKSYEESLREQQVRLAEVMAKLNMNTIGPMVDGGDGCFYGVAGDRLFRLTKDTLEYTLLHRFEGPPLDGNAARLAPMVTREGALYGVTSGGGISGGGVIYRANRDGSDYEVIFNSDQRVLYIDNPVQAPDGTVLASLQKGLYAVENIRIDEDPLDPFTGYARAQNLQFFGPDLFGVAKRGNGQGQIFRYVLATEGASTAGVVAVRETTKPPPPLAVPSDSPEPAQVLFADVELPKPASPSSGGTPPQMTSSHHTPSTQQGDATASESDGPQDIEDPVSDVMETAEQEKEELSSSLEKTAEQVEETAEKAKSLFKSFGF